MWFSGVVFCCYVCYSGSIILVLNTLEIKTGHRQINYWDMIFVEIWIQAASQPAVHIAAPVRAYQAFSWVSVFASDCWSWHDFPEVVCVDSRRWPCRPVKCNGLRYSQSETNRLTQVDANMYYGGSMYVSNFHEGRKTYLSKPPVIFRHVQE
jgi:hypothetical protein